MPDKKRRPFHRKRPPNNLGINKTPAAGRLSAGVRDAGQSAATAA
ncbi:hypothetical protein LHK_00326 [Laribacter hongkongensis HLHK9]|uniref:Uncharacterized protein n=2 Tax=Laribacter hongkongensis TaxID=168471 RepID=C1DBC4_LARHH|nr:hypothetical protein LHK_00326 [Laribacter hongkongensis HLHK9]ASJ23158.1 hypothetical protein LHGZ1_0327 [Laribacter hongkongensis]